MASRLDHSYKLLRVLRRVAVEVIVKVGIDILATLQAFAAKGSPWLQFRTGVVVRGAALQAVKTDINELGGGSQNQRHGHGTDRDESDFMLFEQIENVVLQPRRMSKFHGVLVLLRELSQKFV